jgi:hypothetical protein
MFTVSQAAVGRPPRPGTKRAHSELETQESLHKYELEFIRIRHGPTGLPVPVGTEGYRFSVATGGADRFSSGHSPEWYKNHAENKV